MSKMSEADAERETLEEFIRDCLGYWVEAGGNPSDPAEYEEAYKFYRREGRSLGYRD